MTVAAESKTILGQPLGILRDSDFAGGGNIFLIALSTLRVYQDKRAESLQFHSDYRQFRHDSHKAIIGSSCSMRRL
jgi:hypothetical protein